MRVLLDVNVILDAMLQRAPWHVDADAILMAAAQNQVTCVTTPLALATIFYVGRRTVGTTAARAAIRTYLAAFDTLPIDRQRFSTLMPCREPTSRTTFSSRQPCGIPSMPS